MVSRVHNVDFFVCIYPGERGYIPPERPWDRLDGDLSHECDEWSPDGGLACTRARGHDGPCVAHGCHDEMVGMWYRRKA